MSIANYSDIITEVKAQCKNRPEISDTRIADFISLAEAQINREIRVEEMKKRVTISTVADQDYIEMPADFLALVSDLFIGGNEQARIKNITDNSMLNYDLASGVPAYFTSIGGNPTRLKLQPAPASALDITVHYFAKVGGITATNTSNIILENHPDLYLYAILKHVFIFLQNDSRATSSASEFIRIKEEINIENVKKYSSSLVSTSYGSVI